MKDGNAFRKVSGVMLLIVMLPLLVFGCSGSQEVDLDVVKAKKIIEFNEHEYDDHELTGRVEDGVRIIEVKSFQFFFDPGLIVVNKGERIRLIVTAEDVPHGFEIEGYPIPEYDVNTKIRPGFPMTIEFTAEEVGVWEIVCTIYCGYGHSDMRGMFVVRDTA